MNDDALRALLATPGDACPRADEMWRAAGGELPADELPELLAHVRGCGTCAAAWSSAREAHAALRQATATAPPANPKRANRRWLLSAMVATAAGALLWGLWPGAAPPPPDWRAASPSPIELLVPEAAPPVDSTLRWSAVPDAVSYEVWVTTLDLQTVQQARVVEPMVVLTDLPAGTELLWRVEATLADGSTLSSRTATLVAP